MGLFGDGPPKFESGGTVVLDNGTVIRSQPLPEELVNRSLLDQNGARVYAPRGTYWEVEILVNLWKDAAPGGLFDSIKSRLRNTDCKVFLHSNGSAFKKHTGSGDANFLFESLNQLYPDPTLTDYDQLLLRFVSVEWAVLP